MRQREAEVGRAGAGWDSAPMRRGGARAAAAWPPCGCPGQSRPRRPPAPRPGTPPGSLEKRRGWQRARPRHSPKPPLEAAEAGTATTTVVMARGHLPPRSQPCSLWAAALSQTLPQQNICVNNKITPLLQQCF